MRTDYLLFLIIYKIFSKKSKYLILSCGSIATIFKFNNSFKATSSLTEVF